MPATSLILTVHNKEQLAFRVIHALLEHRSSLARELVIVFDGCSDRSEEEADRALAGTRDISVIKLFAPDVFETKANNIGLRCATGDYAVLIQDDMVVNEKDFDRRLIKPLETYADCFAVSGRAAHNNVITRRFRRRHFPYIGLPFAHMAFTDLVGRENNLGRETFAIRDVVNRGPLALDRRRTEQLGYLDESFAPYIFDDHDLCLRAYAQFGWLCGSYVIDYLSDDAWGTTRQKNNHIYSAALEKNEQLMIRRHHSALTGPKHNENRKLP